MMRRVGFEPTPFRTSEYDSTEDQFLDFQLHLKLAP
jgi:hypothetical protein